MPDFLEAVLRLLAAAVAGMVIGVNRDLHDKPIGARTLGLVALGAALATLASTNFGNLTFKEDTISRVIQGVLTGIGFIGAGVILHDPGRLRVEGLTTAATVWVAAILGIVCGLGAWLIAAIGGALVLLILVSGGLVDRLFRHLFGTQPAPRPSAGEED